MLREQDRGCAAGEPFLVYGYFHFGEEPPERDGNRPLSALRHDPGFPGHGKTRPQKVGAGGKEKRETLEGRRLSRQGGKADVAHVGEDIEVDRNARREAEAPAHRNAVGRAQEGLFPESGFGDPVDGDGDKAGKRGVVKQRRLGAPVGLGRRGERDRPLFRDSRRLGEARAAGQAGRCHCEAQGFCRKTSTHNRCSLVPRG